MTFRIATDLLDLIRAEAAAAETVEVCGLLLGRGARVIEARACRNVAADPTRSFEIDPAALLAAHRSARAGGATILGCYHSHPSGSAEPSRRDAEDAEANGWLWLIVSETATRAWRAVERGAWHGRFEEVALSGEVEAGRGRAPPPRPAS